jgi:DNA-directed RNA polymerase subunit M/transcription elongation factor TFIIS
MFKLLPNQIDKIYENPHRVGKLVSLQRILLIYEQKTLAENKVSENEVAENVDENADENADENTEALINKCYKTASEIEQYIYKKKCDELYPISENQNSCEFICGYENAMSIIIDRILHDSNYTRFTIDDLLTKPLIELYPERYNLLINRIEKTAKGMVLKENKFFKCKKCHHEGMIVVSDGVARSLDEGYSSHFTCTKCKTSYYSQTF